MTTSIKSDTSRSAVLAERDPAALRHLPFFSRRRRSALTAINEYIEHDAHEKGFNVLVAYKNKMVPVTKPARKMLPKFSTLTLEMINDYFDSSQGVGIIHFLTSGARVNCDEMLVRAMLAYRDVIKSALPPDDESLNQERRGVTQEIYRSDIHTAVRIAKSSARELFRYEDVSMLEDELRSGFEALLVVLVSSFSASRFTGKEHLSQRMANLIGSRPDRAHDIVQYQRDRGLELREMSASAVKEYLDTPAASLNQGLL